MSDKKGGLWRWVKEKWANKKGETGKGSGKTGWRPTVKVSEKTPDTWSEMSSAEKRKKTENKKKANKKGGGWSTHKKDRKPVWNTKKSEDMSKNMYEPKGIMGHSYDMTTPADPIGPDYDMYSDRNSIQVGPLTISLMSHDNGCQVCVVLTETGERIAETEVSDHGLEDHMQVIAENMHQIFKACHGLDEFGMEKSEKPFKGYNKTRHAKTGGLNDKYRKKYNRETGSNLKRPVTGKVKAGSKAAKRRKSFCARMSGTPGPTSKDGKLTAKGAALKRWRCSKSEEMQKNDKLIHYSNIAGLGEIDPSKIGTGVGSKQERNAAVPHSFYYRAGAPEEEFVTNNAKHKYTVNLPEDTKLYDLTSDPMGLKQKVREENNGAFNKDMFFQKIKESGFHGFHAPGHEVEYMRGVVGLFEKMPVASSQQRTFDVNRKQWEQE